MKRIILSTCCIVAGFGVSVEAATYARLVPSGNWSVLSQWKDNATGAYITSTVLPGLTDIATINNGYSVDLDIDSTVHQLQVVNTALGGTVNVNSDHTLTANIVTLGVNSTGAGILNQSAGTVSVLSNYIGRASGNSGTYNLAGGKLDMKKMLTVNATGLVDINGGTLSLSQTGKHNISGAGKIKMTSGLFETDASMGQLDVLAFDAALLEVSGGTVDIEAVFTLGSTTANSEFRVIGDQANINIKRVQQASTATTGGTFNFIFNETGISTINATGFITLDGAKIVVDGSAYTGEAGTFTLFDTVNLSAIADTNNITITGFGDKTAYIVQDQSTGKDWVQLVVIPEPATIGMLGLGSLITILLRRMRS